MVNIYIGYQFSTESRAGNWHLGIACFWQQADLTGVDEQFEEHRETFHETVGPHDSKTSY